MGFELEVDSKQYDINLDKVTDKIDELVNDEFVNTDTDDDDFNFINYECDCSLNNGVELISQPATLSYHLSMRDKYDQMFKYLTRETSLRSHNTSTCGLHIHIDNEYLGSTETEVDRAQAKLLYLFERFEDEMTKFSRRKKSQLHWCCSYSDDFCDVASAISNIKNCVDNSSTPTSDDISSVYKACHDKAEDKYYLDRYYNVNITNDNTTEIRLWRGTLKIETFIATLKFTSRLAYLAKNYSTKKLVEMNWTDILGDDEEIVSYWETVKDREI